MSLFVKICGMTDAVSAAAAADAGVQAIGFVFAASPRRVSTAQARDIAEAIPPGVLKVAVFRRPSVEEISRVLDEFDPDLVQADHDALPKELTTSVLPVYREGGNDAPQDGRFLYEGPVSGVGQRVDLEEASHLARRGEMVLAGGLDHQNVADIVATVRPFGVDVSSGVESAPGVKSPELIEEFVRAARVAEEGLVGT